MSLSLKAECVLTMQMPSESKSLRFIPLCRKVMTVLKWSNSVKDGNYIFVEAKSSFPNLHKPDSIENVEKNIYIILNKFVHSLSILSSIHLRVNDVPETEMPDAFYQLSKPSIHFVLVLHFPEGTESICEEIRTVFTTKLSKELMRIWRAKVWVMNEHQAQKMGLVLTHLI